MPNDAALPPFKLSALALKALRKSRTEMLSLDFTLGLDDATPATRKQAAETLLAVNRAIHKLENAALADIRDQLKANEADLKAATDELQKAAKKLEKIKEYVEAAAKVLGVVAKIVGKLI